MTPDQVQQIVDALNVLTFVVAIGFGWLCGIVLYFVLRKQK